MSKSNFKDLALVSAFSKSKQYIYSLIEEINRDVFENTGRIEMNVSISSLCDEDKSIWAFKQLISSSENIFLYYPSYQMGFEKKYIGVLEHGGLDIRIIAQNDKFNYWDTKIDEIIEGLRNAIKWWKTDGRYTEFEEMMAQEDEREAEARDSEGYINGDYN